MNVSAVLKYNIQVLYFYFSTMFRLSNPALLGNIFKPNTLKGYKTSFSHVGGYLEKEFRLVDIDTRKINHSFVAGYDFFLRAKMGCSAMSAAKYIKYLCEIIRICMAHRWIADDPF